MKYMNKWRIIIIYYYYTQTTSHVAVILLLKSKVKEKENNWKNWKKNKIFITMIIKIDERCIKS